MNFESYFSRNNVMPDGDITRAETAAIIFRLLADPNKNSPHRSAFSDVVEGAWYYQSIDAEDIPDWAPSYTDLDESHWAYTAIIEASCGHEFERKYPDSDDDISELWTDKYTVAAALES